MTATEPCLRAPDAGNSDAGNSGAGIAEVRVADVRFPTSATLDGSDAMNADPDYSAAVVVVRTDDGATGHGLTFTIGRGNDVQCAAIAALAPLVAGRPLATVTDIDRLSRSLINDSQLRWLGPEKGVMHMAIGAVVNAAWDLVARRQHQPVWQVVSALSPEDLVALVDFRYISDALSPADAASILRDAESGRAERTAELLSDGYPAYTTTPGWLGYSDDKMLRLAREAVDAGYLAIKLKVGADLADDRRRLGAVRQALGPEFPIAIDANQRWDVPAAVDWVNALADADPYWIEEPTSPDDVLGHATIRTGVAPVRVATGEHVQNRVIFKQMLQAGAIDIVQIDACRVGGLQENLAVMLLAARFGVPVCPHAGGVGLCELVQHLSLIDYVAVSGSLDGRMIEYVDHLHEHFIEPAVIRRGRYVAPRAPGFSAEMRADSVARFTFPEGAAWTPSQPDRIPEHQS